MPPRISGSGSPVRFSFGWGRTAKLGVGGEDQARCWVLREQAHALRGVWRYLSDRAGRRTDLWLVHELGSGAWHNARGRWLLENCTVDASIFEVSKILISLVSANSCCSSF